MWGLLICRGELRLNKPAKIWKEKEYGAVPYYLKPHYIDIHDSYKTRTIEEVKAQLKDQEFDVEVERVVYKPTDPFAQMKGRRARLFVSIAQFKFTELQMLRFKELVGIRYTPKTDYLNISCEMFDNYDQNYTKVNEMLYQIILESKRAP